MPSLASVLELAAHYDAITVRLSGQSLAAFLSTFDALQSYQWEGASLDGLSTAEIDQIDNLVSTAFREIVTPYPMIPIGSIMTFAGLTAPVGWMVCGGAEISREQYADLFAVVGVFYGAGNGSTTFNVPNLMGRVPSGTNGDVATGIGTNQALGTQFGNASYTLLSENMPSHTHALHGSTGLPLYNFSGAGSGRNGVGLSSGLNASPSRLVTDSTGGTGGATQAFNIIQPSLAVNFIIYTGVE